MPRPGPLRHASIEELAGQRTDCPTSDFNLPEMAAFLLGISMRRGRAPEPSIWRARAPISICGPTARMERSEALAGASRHPSTVPDIDPRAGVRGHPLVRKLAGVAREDCQGPN